MRKNLFSYVIASSLLLSTAAHVMEPSDPDNGHTEAAQVKREVVTDLTGINDLLIKRKPGTTVFLDHQSNHLKVFDHKNEMIASADINELFKSHINDLREIHPTEGGMYFIGRVFDEAFGHSLFKLDSSEFLELGSASSFEIAGETQEIFGIHNYNDSVKKWVKGKEETIAPVPLGDSFFKVLPNGQICAWTQEENKIHVTIFNGKEWVRIKELAIENLIAGNISFFFSDEGRIYVSCTLIDRDSNRQICHLYTLKNNKWQEMTMPTHVSGIMQLEVFDDQLVCVAWDEQSKDHVLRYDGQMWQPMDFSDSPVVPDRMNIDEEGNVIFSGKEQDGSKNLLLKTKNKYIDLISIVKSEIEDAYPTVSSVGGSNGLYSIVLQGKDGGFKRIFIKDGQIVEAMRNLNPIGLYDPTASSLLKQFTNSRGTFSQNDLFDLVEKLSLLKKHPKNRGFVFDQLSELFSNILNKAAENSSSSSAQLPETTANVVTELKTEIITGLEAMLEAYPNTWFTPYLHALYFEVSGLAQDAYMAEASFAPMTIESLSKDYDKQLDKYKKFIAGESQEFATEPTPVAERLEYTHVAYETLSEIILQAPAFAEKQGYDWLYEKITLALTQLGKLPTVTNASKDPA